MPRESRGRQRGRHRRPKTAHLPVSIGSFAIATAAIGALGFSNQVPPASALGPGAAGGDLSRSLSGQAAVLDPDAIAAALALRSQETVERSTQRVELSKAAAALQAEAARRAEVTLNAAASEKLERFAEAPAVWVVPIQGYRLTSMFGPRWGRAHTGLDMAVASGTPIRAMSDGEVIFAQYDGSYGNKIIIRHPDGTETWYCHQSALAVRSGPVAAGQIIGYVGSTGNSTGPHLHVEVRPNGGDPIDPLSWMRDTLGLTV